MIFESIIGSRRKLISQGGIVLFLAVLISQVPALPSFAIGITGSVPFGLSPSPDSNGLSRAYYQYQIAPGRSVRDTIVVSDQGRNTETLLLSPASGVTAPNSGTAFQGEFSPCAGTACWITGLPSSVNLSPGQSKTLPFTVTVPAGAAPSQYLAGITAKPSGNPGATVIGGNQQASVKAIVIYQITIGVAITTGNLAQLRSDLVITGVSGSHFGTLPRLMVQVQNQGQRYAKGSGVATCTVNGQKKSLPVNVNTILPDQSATVPVNAVGFSSVADCAVQINYGGPTAASWTGSVKVPVVAQTRQVHIAKGVYATLPPNHIPGWALSLLIAAGVLVLLLVGALLLVLMRRRKGRGGKPKPGSPEGTTAPEEYQPQSQVDTTNRGTGGSSSEPTFAPSRVSTWPRWRGTSPI